MDRGRPLWLYGGEPAVPVYFGGEMPNPCCALTTPEPDRAQCRPFPYTPASDGALP